MAKYSGSTFGTITNKIGGAVGRVWKGIKVVSSLPASVANPRTAAQQAQRSRMAGMVNLFRSISGIVVLGFKELAIQKSEYNAFVGENIMSATTPNWPDPALIDFSDIIIGKGSISSTAMSTLVADTSDFEVTVTYPTTTTGNGQAATDRLSLLIVNQTSGLYTSRTSVAARSAGTAVVDDLPAGFFTTGNVIRVLSFFNNVELSKTSDSTQISVTAVA